MKYEVPMIIVHAYIELGVGKHSAWPLLGIVDLCNLALGPGILT